MWPAIIAAAVLAGLAAILLAAACIPLDLAFSLERGGGRPSSVRARWLFGLVQMQLAPGKGRKAPAPKKARRRRGGRGAMLRVLRTRGLPRRLLRLLREVLGTMRIEDVSARLRVGLDDPADTGILFSVLAPALGAFILPRSSSVSIEPSPARQLEGHARGTIRLRPIRLVPPLVRFAFSRPALRAAGALLRPDGNRRRRS